MRKSGGFTWYGRGKACDTSAPTGPWNVTADEIRDPQTLDIQTRINGELRQSSNTSSMIWTCAELSHFLSVNFTIKPGMMIITGTPAGTVWSVDHELGGRWQPKRGVVAATRYCLPGDQIESEIQSIGVLRNTVIDKWHLQRAHREMHATADDLAFEHVESGKQGRCSVTLVVVGHRSS